MKLIAGLTVELCMLNIGKIDNKLTTTKIIIIEFCFDKQQKELS